jgi:hypothetical protein
MEPVIVTEEEMVLEAVEFSNVYPVLINQIDHIERLRGKLNDFQLMLAVSRAKDAMSILGWERRQTVNATLERYADIYREYGRKAADRWVLETFGFILESGDEEELETSLEEAGELEQPEHPEHSEQGAEAEQDEEDIRLSMQEISSLIAVKEAELLQLYREFYRLSKPNS